MYIGIVGNGFVGKATQLLKTDSSELLVYDIDPEKCIPKGLSFLELQKCRVIFICVPTPMDKKDGSCNTSIIEQCVKDLKDIIGDKDTFIVC